MIVFVADDVGVARAVGDNKMGELIRRIRYLLSWHERRKELADEMEFHREMAAQAGKKNFGNDLRLREEANEAWGWLWLERLQQDLRFAARMAFRSPGFTLAVLLILAVGIGVNLCAFSLFNSVALKLMPVRDAERIVRLERRSPNNYTSEMSYPSFLFYREHAKSLSATMAVLGVPPMQIDDDLQPTSVSFVTGNYFSELGTSPLYGRMLDAADDDGESPAVAVLSYGVWQRRFGGDPSAVGRVIHLNGLPVTVVGVTPFEFASLGGQHPDVWLPIAQQPHLIAKSTVINEWTSLSVRMWGKLAPGVQPGAAARELRSLTDELRKQHPDAVWDDERIEISPGGHLQVMQPEQYRVAALVGVLTLLILVVTCTNIGGLMLARAVAREREIGIRVSLGAGPARIFRQLCTESLMLAAAGSLTGLVLAYAAMRLMLVKTDAPGWISAAPDWRVASFSVFITILAALFFGLAPALQVTRRGRRSANVRQALVGIQIAASCVLLIVASLLTRAAEHAIYKYPGFEYQQLFTIDPQLGHHDYKLDAARSYFDRMTNQLAAVPGVSGIALVKLPPLGHAVTREDAQVHGRAVKIYPNWVSPEFFEVMGIPIRLGRTFYPGEQNAVIVSESFARQQWPTENPLGQKVGEDGSTKDVVVGVVGDAHINALSDDDAMEEYWPAGKDDWPSMAMVVRVATGDGNSVVSATKTINARLDPFVFPEIRKIATLYHENVRDIEVLASVVSAVGMVAVALSCMGIVGLVAYTVSQRMREIAIRMVLGADSRSVLATVLNQFRWPTVVGIVCGVSIAAAGSTALRVALYGIGNLDPASYVAGCVLLIVILSLSMFLPATRALRLNISAILRRD